MASIEQIIKDLEEIACSTVVLVKVTSASGGILPKRPLKTQKNSTN